MIPGRRRRPVSLDRVWLRFWPIAVVLPVLLPAPNATAAEIFEEIVKQTHPLDPGGTLSVRNTDGAIRVYGGNGSEISIQAIKRAYTAERLKRIEVDVKATAKSVAIETIFPPKGNALSLADRSGTVDYIITVPPAVRITNLDLEKGEISIEGLRQGSATAHLVNGWLLARNCFADLDLRIGNGRLDLAYDWWENARFSVKLSSSHGNVLAFIPSGASANVVARAETGRIANAFESPKQGSGEPLRALNFAIGSEPLATLEINAASGNIRIEKTY